MPLEQFEKNSLNHKENKESYKVRITHVPQEVPQSPFLSASLTIEAAIVFPVFLFGLLGILFFFQVLCVAQITSGALAATGSFLSLDTENPSVVKAIGYFHKELLEKNASLSTLVGGQLGIDWSYTTVDGEYVDLQISYQCKSPINLFGLGQIPISQRIRVKKWNGYSKEGEEAATEGGWVYITPSGTAYHRKKDCSYLQLSVQILRKADVETAGYTVCLLCGENPELYPYYYVTDSGEKYHTRSNCTGLKRTIYMVQISSVGERTACGRCGGE